MKHYLSVLGVLCAIALQPAFAETKACLNPHFSYRAQPVGYHDLVAENTIGTHVARVRITTSCIDLHDADTISLSTQFGCLGKGDSVIATGIDGRRQRCIVTRVAPDVQTNDKP